MVLSDFERASGMREFELRARHRVLVFERPGVWWLHDTNGAGRSLRKQALLAFSEVEARLSTQPNALEEARQAEDGTLAHPG